MHQFLVYVYDVNLLGENIHIIKKQKELLLVAIKEGDLEVNAEITMYSKFQISDNSLNKSNLHS
jgi:hypothetical protein